MKNKEEHTVFNKKFYQVFGITFLAINLITFFLLLFDVVGSNSYNQLILIFLESSFFVILYNMELIEYRLKR